MPFQNEIKRENYAFINYKIGFFTGSYVIIYLNVQIKHSTHYENKLTKNNRPTDILQIYTKYLVNVFKFAICEYLLNI